jgi:hypothetical protein
MENELDRSVFLSKNNFADHIELMVSKNAELSYFGAILEFCEEADKDPQDIIQYMSPVLLEKVRKSATDSGLIKADSYDLEDLM